MFLRKAFIKGAGYSDDALDRPIIGIIDTSSGFNPCHGNVPPLVKAVERGVQLSGALPIPFPTISLHESFAHPTSMYLRNLMSIDTEEMIKAQPMDGVVLVSSHLLSFAWIIMIPFRPCTSCFDFLQTILTRLLYLDRRVR